MADFVSVRSMCIDGGAKRGFVAKNRHSGLHFLQIFFVLTRDESNANGIKKNQKNRFATSVYFCLLVRVNITQRHGQRRVGSTPPRIQRIV